MSKSDRKPKSKKSTTHRNIWLRRDLLEAVERGAAEGMPTQYEVERILKRDLKRRRLIPAIPEG